MSAALTENQLIEARRALARWTYDADRGALHRSFRADGFLKAAGLMMDVTLEADTSASRPEWLIAHNRIDVWLLSQGGEGVSASDVALARQIDVIAQRTPSLRREDY